MFGRKLGRWQSRHAREQPVFLVRITGAKAVAWMTALRPLMGERQASCRSIAPWPVMRLPPTALLDDATARRGSEPARDGQYASREVAEQFGTSIWCIYDLRVARTPQAARRGR